jgi:hypothetical protein
VISIAALIMGLLSGVQANPYAVGGQPAGCTVTVNSQVEQMNSTQMLTYPDGAVFCYNGAVYVAVANTQNAAVNIP